MASTTLSQLYPSILGLIFICNIIVVAQPQQQGSDEGQLIEFKKNLMNRVQNQVDSAGAPVHADQFKSVGLAPPHHIAGADSQDFQPVFPRSRGKAENIKPVNPDLPEDYNKKANAILRAHQESQVANQDGSPLNQPVQGLFGQTGQGQSQQGNLPLPNVPQRDPGALPFPKDTHLPNSRTDIETDGQGQPDVIAPGGNTGSLGDMQGPGADDRGNFGNAPQEPVRVAVPSHRDSLSERFRGGGDMQGPGADDRGNFGNAPQEPVRVAVPSHRDSLSERFRGGVDQARQEAKARIDAMNAQNKQQFTRGKTMKIAAFPACTPIVQSLCKQYTEINFAVLDCIQNRPKEVEVPRECQHFLWQYKRNLTTDDRFDSAAREVCRKPLKTLTECSSQQQGSGHLISCLIDHKVNVTSDHNCRQFLNKMSSIVFADYRLMSRFADACNKDILNLGCGRLSDEDETTGSQGKTIRCLSEKLGSLNRDCKHEILRVAELQSDDFHQDRQLFYSCRDDRERFCSNVAAGSGKVFRCLFKHKFEADMTSECRKMLTLRQQLIQADYKVSKTFVDACRTDIRNNDCLEDVQGANKAVKMSMILMCLESAHKANSAHKRSKTVSPECIGEMTDFRKSLMDDYKISPDLVTMCSKEIKTFCGGGLQREGKTLHCLMDLARPSRKSGNVVQFSPQIGLGCLRELKQLMVEADVGEDYRLDRALMDACQPVVEVACRDIMPGGARVLSCLMSHIDTNKMTDDCEERLMEVQYFISRDFRLSHNLYAKCAHAAKELCMTKGWSMPRTEDQMTSEHLYVFSCLHRRLKEKKLEKSCALEVRRVMRERAVSVDLEPRVEEPCMQDLARFCSEETEKGQEVECLQDNLEDLDKRCKFAVGNYTEDAAEDPQLDRILIKSCTPMIKEFCEEKINQNTEPQDVMECLIKYVYNPRMDPKCAAGINHHMILTMKDFRFSWRFKEMCKKDVMRHCKGMKAKADVIYCLSERVHNDTLLDENQRISFLCRKQLRYEKLQMSSSIELSPRLKHACELDIYKRCRDISPGQAKVIECLKKQRRELTNQCHRLVFKREKEEAEDNSIDFALQNNCKNEIKEYCEDEDPKDVLECLKKNKGAVNFERKCRRVVLRRMEIANEDYRLNVKLKKQCKQDVPKFCSPVLKTQNNDEHLEGKVINCLKVKYRQNRLSDPCEAVISNIIREASMDFRQDPVLSNACTYEIKNMCTDPNSPPDEDTKGKVEECLKLKFKQRLIQNKECQKEVLRIIAEGKADIHVDPLLHKSCALDIKHYCFKVPPGEGRQMSCLLAALDDKTIKLTSECYKMLSDRVEMWEYAAKVAPPETVHELMAQITTSPSRHYFAGMIFVVVGMIFIGGLFCGRVTKKLRKEAKNK